MEGITDAYRLVTMLLAFLNMYLHQHNRRVTEQLTLQW
jgi:hypothetical protein